MQNDLISRSELIAEHCDGCDALDHGLCNHNVCGAALLIMEAPAVDAVEVVRCGNCIHRVYKEIGDCEIGGCELLGVALPCDFYCAEGERRADDGK